MDIYGASRASVQACDMAFPSTEMGMAMKRELKKHKPPISLGHPQNHRATEAPDIYSSCTTDFLLGKNFFNRRTFFFKLCTWFSGFLFFSARLKLKTG